MSSIEVSNQKYDTNSLEYSSMNISDYMVAFSGQTNSYCVGIIDMVDSTNISARLSVGKLSRYYQIFLNTMADTINKFGGKVIKNVGDSLLFFFPSSSNGRKYGFMSCLEGCLHMTEMHDKLCSHAANEGLPCINYRISCDYGSVVLMQTKDSALDMIGPPLNMCVKINHFAQNNGIVIGGDLYELVKKMDDYNFTAVKSYRSDQKFQYSVYAVTRR